jgi:hypothetical protein
MLCIDLFCGLVAGGRESFCGLVTSVPAGQAIISRGRAVDGTSDKESRSCGAVSSPSFSMNHFADIPACALPQALAIRRTIGTVLEDQDTFFAGAESIHRAAYGGGCKPFAVLVSFGGNRNVAGGRRDWRTLPSSTYDSNPGTEFRSAFRSDGNPSQFPVCSGWTPRDGVPRGSCSGMSNILHPAFYAGTAHYIQRRINQSLF